MSPNNPGNFVNDLVEMAKAFEALPAAQARIAELEKGYATEIDRVTDRELRITGLKAEIENLQSVIRTLEVDRDHAETMFLEADDRTSRALDFIKATFGNAGSLIQALEPVKAQPEPVTDTHKQDEPDPSLPMEGFPGNPIPGTLPPEPEGLHTTQPQGQSEVPPEPAAILEPQSTSAPMPNALSQADVGTAPSPAPEVAPTHPTSDAPTREPNADTSLASTTDTADGHTTTDQSFPMPAISPGRYAGKTYSAAKQEAGGMWTWPDKDEWLSDGGTLDNFYA